MPCSHHPVLLAVKKAAVAAHPVQLKHVFGETATCRVLAGASVGDGAVLLVRQEGRRITNASRFLSTCGRGWLGISFLQQILSSTQNNLTKAPIMQCPSCKRLPNSAQSTLNA